MAKFKEFSVLSKNFDNFDNICPRWPKSCNSYWKTCKTVVAGVRWSKMEYETFTNAKMLSTGYKSGDIYTYQQQVKCWDCASVVTELADCPEYFYCNQCKCYLNEPSLVNGPRPFRTFAIKCAPPPTLESYPPLGKRKSRIERLINWFNIERRSKTF